MGALSNQSCTRPARTSISAPSTNPCQFLEHQASEVDRFRRALRDLDVGLGLLATWLSLSLGVRAAAAKVKNLAFAARFCIKLGVDRSDCRTRELRLLANSRSVFLFGSVSFYATSSAIPWANSIQFCHLCPNVMLTALDTSAHAWCPKFDCTHLLEMYSHV